MRAILADPPEPLPDVARAVALWLEDRPDRTRVASFAAMPGEPDLSALLEWMPHRNWYYPRVVDQSTLALHRVRGIDGLVSGTFGIPEPTADAPHIEVEAIDAFLCPGLAFDPRGGRLGRGRGYYDRLLAAARPDALRVGICFPNQLVESTFPDPHDVPMNLVICQSGVIMPVD